MFKASVFFFPARHTPDPWRQAAGKPPRSGFILHSPWRHQHKTELIGWCERACFHAAILLAYLQPLPFLVLKR